MTGTLTLSCCPVLCCAVSCSVAPEDYAAVTAADAVTGGLLLLFGSDKPVSGHVQGLLSQHVQVVAWQCMLVAVAHWCGEPHRPTPLTMGAMKDGHHLQCCQTCVCEALHMETQ